MDWAHHFRILSKYNHWATARLLRVIADLSESDYRQNVGLFFGSVHGTLNHLLVGEQMLWFRRFSEGVSPKIALDTQIHFDRHTLAKELLAGALRWEPLISSWPTDRWNRSLTYTTMRGTLTSLPFAATLAHVFNHSTHHRGQITAAMTHLGHNCPELDMVYFLQEISEPSNR